MPFIISELDRRLMDVHSKMKTLLLENGFEELRFIPGNAEYRKGSVRHSLFYSDGLDGYARVSFDRFIFNGDFFIDYRHSEPEEKFWSEFRSWISLA